MRGVAWFAAIAFAVGVLSLLLVSRYALVPGSSRALLAWRLDRWTGEVCQLQPGVNGPELLCNRPPIEDALRAAGVTPQRPDHTPDVFDKVAP